MSTALFATPLQLKQNSVLSGQLDNDKLNFVIKNAQVIHIQGFLGTDLYDKLQTSAIADTLSVKEKTLIDDYINPMLIFFSLYEYIDTGAYSISNKGILKHKDETSETVTFEEVRAIGDSYRRKAEHYSQRLIDFLCDKSSDYPEYNTNSGSDIDPETDSTYGGLYLGY